MPLQPGCTDEAIEENVAKLVSEGRSAAEAVAIALDYAERQGCDVSAQMRPDAVRHLIRVGITAGGRPYPAGYARDHPHI